MAEQMLEIVGHAHTLTQTHAMHTHMHACTCTHGDHVYIGPRCSFFSHHMKTHDLAATPVTCKASSEEYRTLNTSYLINKAGLVPPP